MHITNFPFHLFENENRKDRKVRHIFCINMLEAIGLQYREYERRIISHIKLENSCQVNQRAKCNILFKQLTTLRVFFFFSSQFFFFFSPDGIYGSNIQCPGLEFRRSESMP